MNILLPILYIVGWIVAVPLIALVCMGAFVLVAALMSATIWCVLALMSQVERLWSGTMFLGFASYVSPENRWYRGDDGNWKDRQHEMALLLRPSLGNQS